MAHMPHAITSPVVERIAAAPCALCGGTEWSYFPSVGFEHTSGSHGHHFELLVCRSCRHTFFFNDGGRRLEEGYEHVGLRAATETYR